ncbi:MAG: ribosomal L7Ae/L30e/S12e/Gadd45 family protein [Candidatus Aenigmarchaeota archaeon]|nr:ribosomal L7Ae/L30e/S12e/Gadd45 family protein [Candidatus Aenigmarchaeota archaeon]
MAEEGRESGREDDASGSEVKKRRKAAKKPKGADIKEAISEKARKLIEEQKDTRIEAFLEEAKKKQAQEAVEEEALKARKAAEREAARKDRPKAEKERPKEGEKIRVRKEKIEGPDKALLRVIKEAIKAEKLMIGKNRTFKAFANGSLKSVICASNCPLTIFKDLNNCASISSVAVARFSGDSLRLGEACGKPFNIAIVGIGK